MRAPQARPYVRHLVRVSLVAMLAGLLHVLAIAPAQAASPEGYVDGIASYSPGYVTVSGWTRDQDNTGVSLNVHFYVGSQLFVLPANQYRPDPTLQGNYGFSATVAIGQGGTFAWSATGIDSNGAENYQLIDNTDSGGYIAVADPSPVGNFEAVGSPAHRQISVSGWAGDPNNKAATLDVEVYVGGPAGSGAEGHLVNTLVRRPDVTSATGYGPMPGFAATFNTNKTGRQVVYVYAVNHPGSPGGNTLLGTRAVDVFVDTTPPQTTITSTPSTATTTDLIRVEFSADEPNATFECRWDVAPYAPCVGSTTILLTSGNHLISVRASDVYGNVDPSPATWVVAVTEAVPAPPPPPPPGAGAQTGRTVGVRAVKKKSKLRIDVGPDSAKDNYRVVVQRKVHKKWRKVSRVRTRGDRDVVVVDLRRGKYRVRLPKSAQGPAVISNAVRLRH